MTPFALPVNYDIITGTLKVGTDGSLGIGTISNNMATLVRHGRMTDADIPACSYFRTDTTTMHLTADNTFTASVVENQGAFSASCTQVGITTTGGTCTSMWTWTMRITGALTAPSCE